ncbi:MAG: glycogen synthase GlgA [Chloroflexota bacterium]
MGTESWLSDKLVVGAMAGQSLRPDGARPSVRSVQARLHVAMVSSEIAPIAKTGGLGDVLGALPRAVEHSGVRVSLVMPAYRSVLSGGFDLVDTGITLVAPISGREEEGTLLRARVGEAIDVYLIRADRYFDRDGLYGTAEGDYPDNAERFVFFCRAALEALKPDPPEILHAHDWQSALTVAFLKAQPYAYPELSSAKTVFTVHNLGYQGLFWPVDWHLLNLNWGLFTPRYLEFYGKINLLKGGLVFADAITTVSPSYAEEIKTSEQGAGLDGVFRERAHRLVGILNGVDYDIWNPETDALIARKYGRRNLAAKALCKIDLQRTLSLPETRNTPVIGMVSRLATQKGFYLLERAIDRLLSRELQLVVLGRGEKYFEDMVARLPERYPGKAGVRVVFDERLAHQVIAGSDMFLMPSRYEPSGLTQLYGLKYGTVPVVRGTGGLKDSVQDYDPRTGKGNGIVFSRYEAEDLLEAVDRAVALYQSRQWATLMQNGMAADFSWEHSAGEYLNLYHRLVGVS